MKRNKVNGGVAGLKSRVKTPGTVDVGIIDAGMHQSGVANIAQIGMWNEYGTTRIPERSFIRSTLVNKKNEIINLQSNLLSNISSGKMSTSQALGLLGEFLAGEIKTKIVALKSPPNKPTTIKAKGRSNPLVDTGQLLNSITYEVNK